MNPEQFTALLEGIEHNSLMIIDLQGTGITAEQLRVLGQALKNPDNVSVVHVTHDLSSQEQENFIKEIRSVLDHNGKILQKNLQEDLLDNAEKGDLEKLKIHIATLRGLFKNNCPAFTDKDANLKCIGDVLYQATRYCQLNIVQFMLEEPFEFTGGGIFPAGNEALLIATEKGYLPIVQYLLENQRALIDTTDNSGNNPLLLSIEYGHAHIVRFLLENIATFLSFAGQGRDPLGLLGRTNNVCQSPLDCILASEVLMENTDASPCCTITSLLLDVHIRCLPDIKKLTRWIAPFFLEVSKEYLNYPQCSALIELVNLIFSLLQRNPQLFAEIILKTFNKNNYEFGQLFIQRLGDSKSWFLSVNTDFLPKLMDMYLTESILGQWVIKDRNIEVSRHPDRDLALGSESRAQEKQRRLANIWRLISFFKPEYQQIDKQLEIGYTSAAKELERYPVYDESDDSDSDDEELLEHGLTEKSKQHRSIRNLHSPSFWRSTRRSDTGGSGALNLKMDKIRTNATTPTLEKIKELSDAIKGSDYLKARGQLQGQDKTIKKKYVAQFRGINYMRDRWSTSARRYHYSMQEVGRPQFCESVLRTLYYDFYTELRGDNDFYRDLTVLRRLEVTAYNLRASYQSLRETGACVARTVKPSTDHYVFNSVSDYLQHDFSNGISSHLLRIKRFREANNFCGSKFINAFNYAIATGDRPYHSLKYACGLKDYYEYGFVARYNQDGSIGNSHAGKLYIVLHEMGEFISEASINRVTQMNYAGQVPVDHNIAPEVETSFIGDIPADHVVYQFNIKFPSFNKPYKNIYAVKYGMDETLYACFRYLIIRTTVESDERKKVVELLKEWLCAYYEVLALNMAQRIVRTEKQGELFYLSYEDKPTAEPDLRPFTAGHHDSQNQVHVLQNIRWLLGRNLSHQLAGVHEIRFLDIKLENEVRRICQSTDELDKVVADKGKTKTIKIGDVSVLNASIFGGDTNKQAAKREIAKNIINSKMQSFSQQKRGPIRQIPPSVDPVRLQPRQPTAGQITLPTSSSTSSQTQETNKLVTSQQGNQPGWNYQETKDEKNMSTIVDPVCQELINAMALWGNDIAEAHAIEASIKDNPRGKELAAKAKIFGFTYNDEDSKRDGNCFLHAVAHQLQTHGTHYAAYTHRELRALAAEHILKNWDVYKDSAEGEIDAFIANLIQKNKWADHQMILALSRALNVTLVIIRSDEADPEIFRRPNPVAILYLGYEVGQHYQSLIRGPGLIATESIQNRIERAIIDNFTAAPQTAISRPSPTPSVSSSSSSLSGNSPSNDHSRFSSSSSTLVITATSSTSANMHSFFTSSASTSATAPSINLPQQITPSFTAPSTLSFLNRSFS